MPCVSESERNELRYYRPRGISMAIRKRPANAPEKMLESNRGQLEHLANACGEEAGLHRPLAEVVGGAITGMPADTDLAQALSDRQTTDLLVQLLDENRE